MGILRPDASVADRQTRVYVYRKMGTVHVVHVTPNGNVDLSYESDESAQYVYSRIRKMLDVLADPPKIVGPNGAALGPEPEDESLPKEPEAESNPKPELKLVPPPDDGAD